MCGHFRRCFCKLSGSAGGAGANEGVVGGAGGKEGEGGDRRPGRRAQDSGKDSQVDQVFPQDRAGEWRITLPAIVAHIA